MPIRTRRAPLTAARVAALAAFPGTAGRRRTARPRRMPPPTFEQKDSIRDGSAHDAVSRDAEPDAGVSDAAPDVRAHDAAPEDASARDAELATDATPDGHH